MTVAAYIEPLPEGWPKRSTTPCRDCEHYKHQRCPGCMGTGEERTEDWGLYRTSSWTAGTMDATLRLLGLKDAAGESLDSFSLADLRAAYLRLTGGGSHYDRTCIALLGRRYQTRDLEGVGRNVEANIETVGYNSPAPLRCGTSLLLWLLRVSAAEGVNPNTARVYVA